MLLSRRQAFMSAGLGALAALLSTACSDNEADTAAVGETSSPAPALLAGVRIDVRRDPG